MTTAPAKRPPPRRPRAKREVIPPVASRPPQPLPEPSNGIPTAYAQFDASVGLSCKPFLRTCRFVTGHCKIGGKTTLMVQQRRTLYIDMDNRGSVNVPTGEDTIRVRITNLPDLEDLLKQLRSDVDAGHSPFEHVVFDTVDGLAAMVADFLSEEHPWCKKTGRDIFDYGDGKGGYNLIAKRTMYYPLLVSDLMGLGWTVIGHLRWRTTRSIDGREFDAIAPAVQPRIAEELSRMADFIWRIEGRITDRTQTVVDGEPVVSFTTQFILETSTPGDEAVKRTIAHRGSRVPMIPEVIIPKKRGIDVVEAEYNAACEREAAEWAA